MAKKLAVLVGCNYPKAKFKLHGCVNDVLAVKEVLETIYGFDPSNIQLLIDDVVGTSITYVLPTGANIKSALNKMVDMAEEGAVLFFHFSGYGTVAEASSSYQSGDAFKDEAIVPCDLNLITDMDLRQIIKKLPERSSFTFLSDSCHSGRLIDKDKEQIGSSAVSDMTPNLYTCKTKDISIGTIHQRLHTLSLFNSGSIEALLIGPRTPTKDLSTLLNDIFENDVSIRFQPAHEKEPYSNPLSKDKGILISGCQAKGTSADVVPNKENGEKPPFGAFTNAVVQIVKESKQKGVIISNKQLVMEARKLLKNNGFKQNPCLYCSGGNADAPFLGAMS